MLENIALSFQGVWSHKMRSFLTMLGIIIGIASIITIVSTIKGTNEQIKENLIGAGNNVVSVQLKRSGTEYSAEEMGIPEDVSTISEKVRRRAEHEAGVKEVAVYRSRNSWSANVYYKDKQFEGKILGVDQHYFSVYDYLITYGRIFDDYDQENYRKCAIVDENTANSFFSGENPVGKVLEIGGEPFVVIGVAQRQNVTEPSISSVADYDTYYSSTEEYQIFIPISTWPVSFMFDEPEQVAVRATSTDEMTQAGNNVAKALTSAVIGENSKYKYEANDLLKKASEMQKLSNSTNQQLLWIAGISLLVGGIGVMNIMLVSVTERTKEIGLKKAIGAKRSRIAVQFLTEAAVLTSIGGLIGVVSGIVLSQVLSRIMEIRSSVSIPACIIAVGFSMAIGLVFGLLPAMKASKLNPIDALRSE